MRAIRALLGWGLALGIGTTLVGGFFLVAITVSGTEAGHQSFPSYAHATVIASLVTSAVGLLFATTLFSPGRAAISQQEKLAVVARARADEQNRHHQLYTTMKYRLQPTAVVDMISSSLPPELFMALCECPRCHTEGYHDLRAPRLTRDQFTERELKGAMLLTAELADQIPTFTQVCGGPPGMAALSKKNLKLAREQYDELVADVMADREARALELLTVTERKFDVMRTCSNCKNTWGQYVGIR